MCYSTDLLKTADPNTPIPTQVHTPFSVELTEIGMNACPQAPPFPVVLTRHHGMNPVLQEHTMQWMISSRTVRRTARSPRPLPRCLRHDDSSGRSRIPSCSPGPGRQLQRSGQFLRRPVLLDQWVCDGDCDTVSVRWTGGIWLQGVGPRFSLSSNRPGEPLQPLRAGGVSTRVASMLRPIGNGSRGPFEV